jgi:hypothetical protein
MVLENFRWRTPNHRYRRMWYGYCLFRFCWETMFPDSFVGDGKSFSNKVSVGLSPQWFKVFSATKYDTEVYFLGLRIHYARSYGGRFG